MRRILISFVATFAVALPVFVLAARGGAPPARAEAPAALPPAPTPDASTDQRIAALQATVRAAPKRADGWTLLAGAYLQKVRETGDAGFYARAAGRRRPRPLAAPRRRRRADPAQRARALAPRLQGRPARRAARPRAGARPWSQPFGAVVDALVELGRYPQAERALQEMVDRKPNLAAYARVSYFRELHGDLDGALDAHARGRLRRRRGARAGRLRARAARRARARRRAASARPCASTARRSQAVPGYAAGRGRAGRRPTSRAGASRPRSRACSASSIGSRCRATSSRSARRRPPPGAAPPPTQTFALVRAETMLQQRAGVNADVELALFEADHGSPRRAVALGRRAWAAAPSVRSADALGWALHRAGQSRAALGWARRALALGSRDPAFLHARRADRARRGRAAAGGPLAGAAPATGRAALGAGLREALR